MNKSKSYLKISGILMATAIITTVSFNWFMNPYGIYHSPEIDGINKRKPLFAGQLRLAKAWTIYKRKPDAIILGSSRSECGLDPNHLGWKDAQDVYNLAISGGNMYEALRYFQHAHALKPQKKVVLGLDFRMFNIFDKAGMGGGFKESRLVVDADGNINPQFSISEKFIMLASMDVLGDSIQTFQKQNTDLPYLPNGQVSSQVNAKQTQKLGGNHKAFRFTEKKNMNLVWFQRPHQYEFIDPNTGQSSFDDLRRLLDTAYRDNIDLRMLVSPSHARLWEALHAVGLWSKFEQWKRELVTINEQQAKKYGKQPFPLWDFSGYNSYTTENVTDNMKWYWESSHYKEELGNIVLDSVFERKIADDFGVLINTKNIDKHLADIRIQQQQYRKDHPIDAAEVLKLAEETVKQRQ
jgi:hypothetical protein